MTGRKIVIRFCNNIRHFSNEINKRGGGIFSCGGWNFSKSVSVGPTFIREMRVGLLLAWSWYSLQELESSEEWPQSSRKFSLRVRPALPAGSKVLLEQKATDLFAICD
jgi:hypothetical protein